MNTTFFVRNFSLVFFVLLCFTARSANKFIVVADLENPEWEEFADILQKNFSEKMEVITYDEVIRNSTKPGAVFYGIWVGLKPYYSNDTSYDDFLKNIDKGNFIVPTSRLRILFGELSYFPAIGKKQAAYMNVSNSVLTTFPKNPQENDWKEFYKGNIPISKFVEYGTPEIVKQQFKLMVNPAPDMVISQVGLPLYNFAKDTKKYIPNQPVYISRSVLQTYPIKNGEVLNFQAKAEEEYLKELPKGSKFVSEEELSEAIRNKENFYFIFSLFPYELYCLNSVHNVVVVANDNLPKHYPNLDALLKVLVRKMN